MQLNTALNCLTVGYNTGIVQMVDPRSPGNCVFLWFPALSGMMCREVFKFQVNSLQHVMGTYISRGLFIDRVNCEKFALSNGRITNEYDLRNTGSPFNV